MAESRLAVGLALSGGGIRAMAFHCGVLRWLAETERFEQVTHVSSVSGGTLLTGLIMASNGWRWPSSQQYLGEIQPRLKSELTKKSLALTGFFLFLHPKNWRYLLSRANVLSQAIERCWGIQQRLSELPRLPIWSINGTTAETGRRFRFKLDQCGDYELGYAEAGQFKIADAMAVSAALPGAIGPLAIVSSDYKWMKRPQWDAPTGSERPVVLPYQCLHIYDGGLYDNLALEPLMDPGTQSLKNEIDYLLCSDAGALLKRVTPGASLSPFRALRILDVAMDQARLLRVRPLANFLKNNPRAGAYAQIGANPLEGIRRFEKHNPSAAAELLKQSWLPAEDITRAVEHPTTLRPLSEEQFERLERHGYESVRWNEILFSSRESNSAYRTMGSESGGGS